MLTILAIKEMQIKTTLRFLLEWLSSRKQKMTNVGKDAGEKESSYTADGKVNLYHRYEKQYGDSSKT
jgi:hypothetical protein